MKIDRVQSIDFRVRPQILNAGLSFKMSLPNVK